MMEGDPRAVLATSEKMLKAMPEGPVLSDPEEIRIYNLGLSGRASALAALGRIAEAEDWVARAIEEAWKHDDPSTHVNVFSPYNLSPGQLLSVSAETLARAREAVEETETLGSVRLGANAYMALGSIFARMGDWEAAAACMRKSAELQRKHRLSRCTPFILLAELLLEGGDARGAQIAVEESFGFGDFAQARLMRCRAYLAHGRALVRTEGRAALERIEQSFTQAQEITDEAGVLAYQPLVHIARAELAELLGNEAKCEHELREAQRIYTEMEATAQAERVATKLQP
jgi:tetratricopeptide (TPR) repeat protein